MTGTTGEPNSSCPLRFYSCDKKERDGRCKLCLPDKTEKPCMLGVAENLITPEDLAALSEDAHTQGYKAIPVEYHILRLDKADGVIELEGDWGPTQDLKKETDKKKFLPLPCKSISGVSQHRASEFNKKYHCQRIFSKIDHKKLGFPDGLLARVGTAYHAICNQQHLDWIYENDILKELGIGPINRKEYCEVGLLYNYNGIITSAHADELLQFLPNDKKFGKNIGNLAVLDMKRKAYSMHEEKGHKMQLLANVLGARQTLGLDSKSFYVITSKRPRRAVRGRYRMPEYHITKIYITDEIVKDFHAELLNTHVAQKLLLDNRNIWNSNKKHLRACGDCAEGKCYDCGVCNYVTRIMTKNKIDMRKTLEDKLKAVLPNKELPA